MKIFVLFLVVVVVGGGRERPAFHRSWLRGMMGCEWRDIVSLLEKTRERKRVGEQYPPPNVTDVGTAPPADCEEFASLSCLALRFH